MHYIFVINSSPEKSFIHDEVKSQLNGITASYEVYCTVGPGDATRFVNVYCDLNPKEEVCFVACGGAGTLNEVVSGMVGKENKYVATLSYGGTNDLTKCFPGHDFQSVEKLLKGETKLLDIIKINDNYSINVSCVGMDAYVTWLAEQWKDLGKEKAYKKSILSSLLFHRFNKYNLIIDGKRMGFRRMTLCDFCNGQYSGGAFRCAPDAEQDDGYMKICCIKSMTLISSLIFIKHFAAGTHLESRFCRKRLLYVSAKSAEIQAKDLIYLGFDGETIASTSYRLDVLNKAVKFILPKK